MGEVLSRVIRKRRLQMQGDIHLYTCAYVCTSASMHVYTCVLVHICMHACMYMYMYISPPLHPSLPLPPGYELERKDNPGVPVDMSSTLRSQGTLDFVLIKNISRKERTFASVFNIHMHVLYMYMCIHVYMYMQGLIYYGKLLSQTLQLQLLPKRNVYMCR